MEEAAELTEKDLIALADKSNAFARGIVGEWKDTFAFDARGFQLRYLYSNAYRAAVSAQSFWLLHSSGRFHDAQIISRTLLERIVNNRVAKQSPERACSLLATNRWKDREGVRKMVAFDHPEMQWNLDLCQTEINKFLELAGRTEVLQWNFFDMCKEVDLEWAYRMLYGIFPNTLTLPMVWPPQTGVTRTAISQNISHSLLPWTRRLNKTLPFMGESARNCSIPTRHYITNSPPHS